MTTTNTTANEVILPPQPPGPVKWVADNLFSNWFNTLLTLIFIPMTLYLVIGVIDWTLNTADWRAVTQSPLLYAVGQYPRDQLWRVGAGLSGIMLLFGISWGNWGGLLRGISITAIIAFSVIALLPVQHDQLDMSMRLYLGGTAVLVYVGYLIGRIEGIRDSYIVLAWVIVPILAIVLLNGFEGNEFLEQVSTTAWGGLLVTFILAIGGIVISFPIGVLLALGRRSSLPVVSAFSTLFIELIRGVPLITILFMFSIILALFLPSEARIDRVVRALMAVTFFSAAYTAENIRGGLAAVPEGQIEAAKAVGMSGFQTMLLIVLPQAIRAVLPAIVGQFISLFKDTTLVVIVGINELLGIGRSIINSDPEFVQLQLEVYLFLAVVYWIFCYLMSLASRQLETAMGVGQR
jgi:general L-amino acid transport system permease protein